MPYKVGVSTGWWGVARDPNLLGMVLKAGYGATSGIQFSQVDLETTSEFFEPRLNERMKRFKKELGMEIGLHAELGEFMALESGQRRLWDQSHLRLCETVKHSAELGVAYINLHLSMNLQVYQEEERLKPFGHQYQVVGYDGKPLPELCRRSAGAKREALRYISYYSADDVMEEEIKKIMEAERKASEKRIAAEMERHRRDAEREADRHGLAGERRAAFINQALADRLAMLQSQENSRLRERNVELMRGEDKEALYNMWLLPKNRMSRYFIAMGEIGAYMIVAAHMRATSDMLWSSICKSWGISEAYESHQPEFNAAVAAKYIQGHLERKDHEANRLLLGGMSIKEFIEKNNIYITFETPEIERPGSEGLYRLYKPIHAYYMIKAIGSSKVTICIDFEHTLSQKLNPSEVISEAPGDFGKHVQLLHLGTPIPYSGKAHIPIPFGSHYQEVLYEWIYELRKKGFKDGYIIFERGGGRKGGGKLPFEVFEYSVWVMRQIVNFLERDLPPKELPPEFFGISVDNKDIYARQYVEMRNHAWDPLEGLLMIPEEKHTFLGKAAVDKGKAQEWEKRKFR